MTARWNTKAISGRMAESRTWFELFGPQGGLEIPRRDGRRVNRELAV
jgi:hypothetical protein